MGYYRDEVTGADEGCTFVTFAGFLDGDICKSAQKSGNLILTGDQVAARVEDDG